MAIFAVCEQFKSRLDTTELLIYTRGESTTGTTSGAKRLVRMKQLGGGGGGGKGGDQGGQND